MPITPPDWSPGDDITSGRLNEMNEAIRRATPNGSGGVASGSWGWSIAETPPDIFWATVTGNDAGAPPGHTFYTATPAREQDDGSPLYEENDSAPDDDSMRAPLYEANGGLIPDGITVRAWKGNGDYYLCEYSAAGGPCVGGTTTFEDYTTNYLGTSVINLSDTTVVNQATTSTFNFAGIVNVAATAVWTILAATFNYTSTVLNYTSTTFTYVTSVFNYTSATLNFAAASVVNWAGAAFNITQDSSFSISADKTWEVDGPGFYIVSAPMEICGYQFWCYQTIGSWGASQNDLALGAAGTVYRVSSSTAVNLTGIVPEGDKQVLALVNYGSEIITLKHLSGSSSPANKLQLPNGMDFKLSPFEAVVLWYDPVITKWRALASTCGFCVLGRGQGTAASLAVWDDTETISDLTPGSANQVLGMNNGATAHEYKTVTAGSGISVTHCANSVTIAATGGGGVTVGSEGTLAAAGSVQGDAAAIVTDSVMVSGADGTKGVILPNVAGAVIAVGNDDAVSTLKIYPHSGARVGTSGVNTAVTLLAKRSISFIRMSSTLWVQTAAHSVLP